MLFYLRGIAFAELWPSSAEFHPSSAEFYPSFAEFHPSFAEFHPSFAEFYPSSAESLSPAGLSSPWNYYLIAFIEAYLYNISLGAKPMWHGRNIRVTPKNAITARICWAFFVL